MLLYERTQLLRYYFWIRWFEGHHTRSMHQVCRF